MKEIYTSYARYNRWANSRMVDLFSALPAEMVEQPIVSSFPSVKLTFLHIWDAELIWLKRLQGISVLEFPSKQFKGNSVEVFEKMLENSGDFARFVEDQPAEFFEQELTFTTISSGEQQQKAFEMIHHCMNHSTFHRGQLVMMGRQLGVDKIKATDLIHYLRDVK